MNTSTRPLGKNQRGFLRAMQASGFHRERSYYPGCGWLWSTQSESIRIAESLVRRGLLETVPHSGPYCEVKWVLTGAGQSTETATR